MLSEKSNGIFSEKPGRGGARSGAGRKKGGRNTGYNPAKVSVSRSVTLPSNLWGQLEKLFPGQSAVKSAAAILKSALKEKQGADLSPILDVCCGSRMFYYDKNDPRVLFLDKRREEHILCDGRKLEIKPDILADFTSLPFEDNSFSLIVFDPPHLISAGEDSWMRKKYGKLDEKNWQNELHDGFVECWRVLKYSGSLIFKWNETQISLSEVLECFPERPIFGHRTTNNLKTHWVVFHKSK